MIIKLPLLPVLTDCHLAWIPYSVCLVLEHLCYLYYLYYFLHINTQRWIDFAVRGCAICTIWYRSKQSQFILRCVAVYRHCLALCVIDAISIVSRTQSRVLILALLIVSASYICKRSWTSQTGFLDEDMMMITVSNHHRSRDAPSTINYTQDSAIRMIHKYVEDIKLRVVSQALRRGYYLSINSSSKHILRWCKARRSSFPLKCRGKSPKAQMKCFLTRPLTYCA